jgi:putative SOS response-associated peptidase YedK
MPVILHPKDFAAWLDPEERHPNELLHLLAPLPPEMMEAFPVSTVVNNARIDRPICLEPAGEIIRLDQPLTPRNLFTTQSRDREQP